MKLATVAVVATFALAVSACSGGPNAGTAALPAASSMSASQMGTPQMIADPQRAVENVPGVGS